jgi:signal transduction histidine kinase
LDRRSEALAQLLETALSERFATPVIEVLQALPIPVAVVEPRDLRVLALNDAMAQLFRRPDAAGLTVTALLPPANPLSDPRPYRKVAAEGRPLSSTVVLDGQTWEWFIHPLKGESDTVEHCLTGLVARPSAPLDPDMARLQEMNAAKREFLNMAAHELRTPLSVIIGYGSLLAQGGLSADHQKLAGARVYEKARQLSRLIMDMHLVGRFDELGPSMPTAALDLVRLVEPIVTDQQRRFGDLAIDFSFDNYLAPVRGNDYWLHLAVRELLDNAVRFRPAPTGRIDVSLKKVGEYWSLNVLDDGFGIDPKHQGQLFKRFARIETDANRHLIGLGIGLYIVQEVAQAHAGRVKVDSRPGLGSEFSLEIPAIRIRPAGRRKADSGVG